MKKITIELTDSEYQDITAKAKEVIYSLEDYIILTARLYKDTYETGLTIYREKEEERIDNEYLKHKIIIYAEKNKALEEENKLLKQNLGIKE